VLIQRHHKGSVSKSLLRLRNICPEDPFVLLVNEAKFLILPRVKCHIRRNNQDIVESPSSASLATTVDQSLKFSPSSFSVNSSFSPSAAVTAPKVAKKKINSTETQNSSLVQQQADGVSSEPVVKSKIERLEVKKLVPSRDQLLLMQVDPVSAQNDSKCKLDKIEKNVTRLQLFRFVFLLANSFKFVCCRWIY